MIRSRTRGAVAALCLGVILAAVTTVTVRATSTSAEFTEVAPATNALQVDVPSEVLAGDGFQIEVRGGSADQPVSVLIEGSYGVRRFDGHSVGGVAIIDVPANPSPESGTILIEAIAGNSRGWVRSEVVPGPAVGPLDLYLGPRTIVADADDLTMIVAVPVDELGNPVGDGTIVDFRTIRPNGQQNELRSVTSRLLSEAVIRSGTVAGRSRVIARSGVADGPERTFLEVADRPERFELRRGEPVPWADGATLVEIRTDRLVDANGNQLPDGTMAVLGSSGPTGTRRLPGFVLDGVVRFTVEAPDRPGIAIYSALVGGTVSGELTIDFAPAVAAFVVEILDHPDGTEVRVGQVVTGRGGYVPDGTVASVRHAGQRYETKLELGSGSIVLHHSPLSGDRLRVEDLAVSVLGVGATDYRDLRS